MRDGLDVITKLFEHSATPISFYPNPVSETINIIASEYMNFHVTIYNLEGRAMHKYINPKSIQVQNFPMGVYFMEIQDFFTGEKMIERFVKR